MATPFVRDVLQEVHAERNRQDRKWGEQNHPDIHPVVLERAGAPRLAAHTHGIPSARDAKAMTDSRAEAGLVSWADIAVEELAEAVEAAALGQTEATRTEIIQLAAVCVQWVQAIDRREAPAEVPS